MKVRFTPSARRQFLRAIDYLRERNPLAAARFNLRASKTLRRLGPHPHSGRKIPEFPEFSHRELVVPPYRLFYRTEVRTIWIVAIWHDARLPDAPEDDS